MTARSRWAAALLVVSIATATGCHSRTVTDAGIERTPTGTTSAATAPPGSAAPGRGRAAYTARQLVDDGLPSKIGPGALTKPQVKQLMQYFENKVAHAYATGRSDSLTHYLAGPMLSGNRATIQLLAAKHKRNVFHIDVVAVHLQANEATRLVFAMTGDMTSNYFVDTATGRVLDHGLPGPSQVKFLIFLDQNPATRTWYWTGEQSQAAADNATGSG
ncbi:MAG TPA: hypothetical protein VG708_12985 [Mycobacteriales bacterium]|nr:hypothetical protein [Mycobacteriales bacterium]